MRNVGHPYGFDDRGRTAGASFDQHVRDLIEAVLFTAPGERVNRPDFGAGVGRLVFEPNSAEVAAATQFLVQGGLQQALGDLVEVRNVEVRSEGSALRVIIDYASLADGNAATVEFERGGP